MLDKLPWLALEKILSLLGPADLCHVGACNYSLYESVNNDMFWFPLVRRREWDRYGPGRTQELLPKSHDEEFVDKAYSNKVSTSPRFLLDGLLRRDGFDKGLPKCCSWHQVFLRSIHLNLNWRLGRYSVWPRLQGHRGRTDSIVDMCSDNQMAVTGCSDGSLCLWNLLLQGNEIVNEDACPVRLQQLIMMDETVVSVTMSKSHIAASTEGMLIVLSQSSGNTPARILHSAPFDAEISFVKAAPHHPRLAIITEPTRDRIVDVYLWNLVRDRVEGRIDAVHVDEVTCAVVDDTMLITASWDGSVAVLDMLLANRVAHLTDAHAGAGVTCLRYLTKGGSRLLSGGADGSLCCWQFRFVCQENDEHSSLDISPLWSVEAVVNDGEVYCVDANETTVVSGGSDSLVRVWSWEGELRRVLEGHHGVVRHLSLSQEGRLVSAGDVKMIFVWDLNDEKELRVRLHRNPTLAGRMLVWDTLILVSSSNSPPELTALGFW